MARFDTDWVARYAAGAADLPPAAGVSAIVQYSVEGGPGGKVHWHEVLADGRVVAAEGGKAAEPDVTVTWKHDVAVAVLAGDVDDDVAYMRGDTKVDGDYEVWLDALFAWRTSPERRALLAELLAD